MITGDDPHHNAKNWTQILMDAQEKRSLVNKLTHIKAATDSA